MDLKRISKFMSLVLRHEPQKVGLTLDQAGWTDVNDFLNGMAQHGLAIDRATLERVVAENDKRRFAFSDDGQRIRANQGHSVEVDLNLTPLTPPATLHHGTAERNVASILATGLNPGSRHHVHLSADTETARRVGLRHGKPVVFHIDAARMHAAGHAFFRSENGVWLTAHVPPEYLSAPSYDSPNT